MRTTTFLTLATLLMFTQGCDVPAIDVPDGASSSAASSASSGDESNEPTLFGKEDYYLADGRVDMSDVDGEPPMTTSTPREVTAKDPKQGKLTRRKGGALGTSLKALPWAKNEMTFLVIKKELETYNAIKGDYPKSHEEFMEKYIPEYCPQVLPLPELEAGDEYIYDPEDHLLKTIGPRDKRRCDAARDGHQ